MAASRLVGRSNVSFHGSHAALEEVIISGHCIFARASVDAPIASQRG
jgi:hypothetical protein